MKSEDVMEIRGALDLLRRDVEDAKSDLNEFVMDGMDMSEEEFLPNGRRGYGSTSVMEKYTPRIHL